MISEEFYRSLALKVSDQLSSRLKVNFDMKDLQICDGSYEKGMKDAPKFAYVAVFKHDSQGLVVVIDPKIVYMLSNRMLGGNGLIEEKDSAHFTDSEEIMARELCEMIGTQFHEQGVELEFDRAETDMGRVHYFYPDDNVQSVSINCKFNDKKVGGIFICHQYIMGEPVLPLHTGLVL